MVPMTRFCAPRLARGSALKIKSLLTRQRASAAAVVFGAIVGLGVGFAYLGGAVAQSAEVRGQANRMLGAYDSGFTEEALAAAVGGLDQSALQVARRHDPYTIAGDAQRDRQAAQLTALLQRRGQAVLTQASGPTSLTIESARPFRLNGALEDSRDLDCLTTAVYYEARGEGRAGMQAVAQVILNRARHPAYPQSVCGVVYQGAGRRTGCQFSFVCNGAINGRRESGAWERSRQVAASALGGSVFAPVGNATHFHTTAVRPSWSGSLVRVGQVGSHIFYRFGGRRGASSQFAGSVQPSSRGDVQTVQAPPADSGMTPLVEASVTLTNPDDVPVVDMSAAAPPVSATTEPLAATPSV